jgi:hypothetical protein
LVNFFCVDTTEQHTQKAFLRKNTEGYPFDSKNSNLLKKSKT